VVSLGEDFCEASPNDRWTLGISAVIRVTLKDGCYHEDLGFGVAENIKGKGAALEKAKKEAITDVCILLNHVFGKIIHS
jgi:DNA recombination protein Rad52